jgi:tight adherence protein B
MTPQGWAVVAAGAVGLAISLAGARGRAPVAGRTPAGRRVEVLWPIGLLGAVVMVVPALPPRRTALVLIAVGAAAGVSRLLAARRRTVAAAARAEAVATFSEALLGELLAGQGTLRALERAVETWSEGRPLVAAARLGADVSAVFGELARLPGAAPLARLGSAWALSADTGTGLAHAVEQVLDTARADRAVARMVAGEVASARATARLVVALPVVVLVAAQGIGAQSWRFLLDTTPGLVCLGAGMALALAGLRWIDRVAESATGGT